MEISDFKNRFQKVYRHIHKWSKRNEISCYRIYDWDIPNHPLVIDRYEDNLHIAEYKSRHTLTESEHEAWLNACIDAVAQIAEISLVNIFVKERRKLDRKVEQYEKQDVPQKIITVRENGLLFKVNLTDYLDTGLFLDHRPLRKVVKEISEGKTVLNLFSYTGSFSVYAASGGAASVTTVDLSNTYIQWAKDNFLLNDLSIAPHQFIVSDVMKFLQEDSGEYDLVIVDPPSFSNSKKLKGTWDTQRDHRKMLQLIYKRLAVGGVVFFSNNLRSFEPDFSGLLYGDIAEWTHKTIPEDFRNKKIHRSFRMVK